MDTSMTSLGYNYWDFNISRMISVSKSVVGSVFWLGMMYYPCIKDGSPPPLHTETFKICIVNYRVYCCNEGILLRDINLCMHLNHPD